MINETTLERQESDVLEAIDRAASEGVDTWEMLISAGIAASEITSHKQWELGDLALQVVKSYGEDSIGKWAKQIKQPVKTIKNYRTVCTFWDKQKSPREDFLVELSNVYFSHYREAMRLKDMEAATEFIEECHLNDWSVEQASVELDKRLGKEPPPMKLVDTELPIYKLEKCKVTFELSPEQEMNLFEAKGSRRVVRLVIYEVKAYDQTTA